MNPSESEWQSRFWELVARKAILYTDADEGVIDESEWQQLINDMIAHDMHGMANNVKRRLMIERSK